MTNFKDLNLETKVGTTKITLNDATDLEVRAYLPVNEKIALIEYVVNHALDESTGRFSPIREGIFFDLALVHFYAGINFEDDVIAAEAYDALDTNGVFDKIIAAIPESEYESIVDLVSETTKDIADYNSSFAGVMQIASSDADGLNNQITEILGQIRNKEGLELLDEIKNVAGKG